MNKTWKLPVKLFLLGTCLLLPLSACNNNRNPNVQQKSTGLHPVSTINPSATTTLRFRIADQTANEIAKMPEINQANVLVTDRNAYVAAVLIKNQVYTPDLENRIVAKVRSVDPNIDNVYVSVNPDFVGRVNAYVNDVKNGRPVSGLVNELSDAIYRLFPKAR